MKYFNKNSNIKNIAGTHGQRGVSLFVVIVFVMLTMLLALWASRTSYFNELVVGNDADYQRAFEAAQALLQDAELDIGNVRADGKACDEGGLPAGTSDRVCRRGSVYKIPLEAQEVGPLFVDLNAETTKCRNALCVKRTGKQDFWNNSSTTAGITFAQMKNTGAASGSDGVAARYGQYTGAAIGSSTAPASAILADRSSDTKGGWYWIEVLPYDETTKNSGLVVDGRGDLLPLNITPNIVYRITAIAYGLKSSTMVVLQQTYAQQKQKD